MTVILHLALTSSQDLCSVRRLDLTQMSHDLKSDIKGGGPPLEVVLPPPRPAMGQYRFCLGAIGARDCMSQSRRTGAYRQVPGSRNVPGEMRPFPAVGGHALSLRLLRVTRRMQR